MWPQSSIEMLARGRFWGSLKFGGRAKSDDDFCLFFFFVGLRDKTRNTGVGNVDMQRQEGSRDKLCRDVDIAIWPWVNSPYPQ